MYDASYQAQLDNRLWTTAPFPESWQTVGPPRPGQRLRTPAMRANRHNFFSACFGDEEFYSENLVGWLKQFFDLLVSSLAGPPRSRPDSWSVALRSAGQPRHPRFDCRRGARQVS
ncbi:hypothetical protein [Kribbella catacumbae]|uniref:hypothetical protein n=1 Tax=Kribbella catacumbae TaxID=460086 RepID=UPI00037BC693|nr:hypothetical protein [Kribbella catacumbae]